MKIAVEGCAHGELDTIYATINKLEEEQKFKVDLLICCGDFQACRNEEDLRSMAVSPKYYNMRTFYKYYNGEKVAPVLTIFVGGNHEASNYLQELPYGGWVAPNIYYLGYAGVINIAGIRIGGLSGIYKGQDYMKGHYEHAPYSESTKRSVYHIRNLEIFRLKQISEPMNIFISHDWPSGVWNYGNKEQLLRFKPMFEDDMNSGQLGSKPTEELISVLKPDYWFAAHLHCKFAAVIPHSCDKITKFLALDKCLPQRRFLQMLDIPHNADLKLEIVYDVEWLTVLNKTNHLLSIKNVMNYLPSPAGQEQWCFVPTQEDKIKISQQFGTLVPPKFVKTAPGFTGVNSKIIKLALAVPNPQTVQFCEQLSVDDPLNLILNLNDSARNSTCEVSIDNTLSGTSPVQKRSSLVLPEPIGDATDTFVDSNISTMLSEASNDTIETPNDGQTSGKKFKRRNASIYQSESIND